MAVVRSANVISATANADTITGPIRIEEINVQAGAGGITVRLRKATSGGAILFEAIVAANLAQNFQSRMRVPEAGIYVEIAAGSGTIYLYSE